MDSVLKFFANGALLKKTTPKNNNSNELNKTKQTNKVYRKMRLLNMFGIDKF